MQAAQDAKKNSIFLLYFASLQLVNDLELAHEVHTRIVLRNLLVW
jgi:hypothetical protein